MCQVHLTEATVRRAALDKGLSAAEVEEKVKAFKDASTDAARLAVWRSLQSDKNGMGYSTKIGNAPDHG